MATSLALSHLISLRPLPRFALAMQPGSDAGYYHQDWPTTSGNTYNSAGRRPSAATYQSDTFRYDESFQRRQSAPETSTRFHPQDQSYVGPPAPYDFHAAAPLQVNTQLGITSPQSAFGGANFAGPPSSSTSSPLPPEGENQLQPSWRGFVHTAWDAAKVVEACLDGTLMHCPRRPHDRERQHVIKSGSIFVYEASTSGIKRWTDGLTWSPSRINGNFLVYRELKDSVQQGSKRRTAKRSRQPNSREGSTTNLNGTYTESASRATSNEDRPYIGSLSDSYDFKQGGLVKKTISFTCRNQTHHVICYYTLEDAKAAVLPRPHQDQHLYMKHPRPELQEPRNFKAGPHHGDDNLAFYQVVAPYPASPAQYYTPQPTYPGAPMVPQHLYNPTPVSMAPPPPSGMMMQGHQQQFPDPHSPLQYEYQP